MKRKPHDTGDLLGLTFLVLFLGFGLFAIVINILDLFFWNWTPL